MKEGSVSLEASSNDKRQTSMVSEAFATYRHRLADYVRQRIRDADEAEDLVQDVFYQLASSVSVTEPIENLSAWLFAVARNKLTDWYRKRRPVALSESHAPDDHSGRRSPDDLLSDPQKEPDEAYWRATVWTELAEALEDLPGPQREVFVWHELEGRSFKEIAELTGESVNTLLSRKRYAVLALRERLQELYDELETT